MAGSAAKLADMTGEGPGPWRGGGGAADQSRDDAMEIVYRLHGMPLYRYLLRITRGDRGEAEDLFQETLLRAWRYLEDHETSAEELRPWLFTVARRLAIDAFRARRARPAEVIIDDLTTFPAPHDADQLVVRLAIRQGLASLSAEHRRVLLEVFYLGRSAREAAEVIGVPAGTVRSRVHYAMQALRAFMTEAAADAETGQHPTSSPRPRKDR